MNLSTLKSALEPLRKFGQKELTFDVEGTQVSLRGLLPREEVACQSKASEILRLAREEGQVDKDDNIERGVALSYFDSFRIEVVAYAIVAIGEHDFRNVRSVETGETLPNGTPVRIPLQKALRDLISEGWSRGMITVCFSKYGTLVAAIAQDADKIVETSVADIDLEIDRLKARVEALVSEKAGRAKGDPSVTNEHIQSLVAFGDSFDREIKDTIEQVTRDRELAEEMERAQAVQPRTPVTPASAPPPTPVARAARDAASLDPVQAARKAAAEASRASIEGVSQATVETANIEGEPVEAYRLPAQTLSSRGSSGGAEKRQKKDPTRNPKFKPQG